MGLSIEMIDQENYKKANLYKYQRLVKKLIYLSCETRPDIVFVLRQFSKHNADQRKSHLQVVKRVVRYLKKTVKIGVTFDRE